MQNLVLILLGMSLDVTLVICAVCLLRFAFRRLPKSYSCALWLLVLFRLLCPITISSSFGLMPDIRNLVQEEIALQGESGQDDGGRFGTNVTKTDKMTETARQIEAAGQQKDQTGTNGEEKYPGGIGTGALQPAASDGSAVSISMRVSAWEKKAARGLGVFWREWGNRICLIWAVGAAMFAAAYLIQYVRLSRQVKRWQAIRAGEILGAAKGVRAGQEVQNGRAERIMENADVQEPFVYGVLRPVICLPADMEDKERAFILHHERMHIRHLDPAFRFLWQIAMILHWFNPFVWAAVTLMQKDMEMFCDESVMKECGSSMRKEYAMTLLRFSVKRSGLPFPIAFGESNTESRIRHILKVKKPAFMASVLAVLAIVISAAVFLTSRGKEEGRSALPKMQEQSAVSEEQGQAAMPETQEQPVMSETEEYKNDGEETEDRAEKMLDLAQRFADAFINRDGDEMVKLLADPSKMDPYKLEEGGYAIGWSSPWPWGGYECRFNYAYDRNEVVIYYYAMTSDPRIWPWRQVLWLTQKDGEYFVENGEIDTEAITSVAAFKKRFQYESSEEYGLSYGTGYRFRDTPMDFLGQAQKENDYVWVQAMWEQSDRNYIQEMYGTPEAAAATQLYLEGGQAEEVESPWEKEVCLRWKFADGETDVIRLGQLYTDRTEKEARLWVVKDILEEQEYQEYCMTLAHERLVSYYLDNPEKLQEEALKGVDGLMEAVGRKSGAVQLAETNDGKEVLYGLVSEGDMMGVFLSEGGKLTYFDWYYASSRIILPVMTKADYDGDGQEELAVTLCAYGGTGVSVAQLFMLEKTADGLWEEREYLDTEYLGELEAGIEISFEKEENKVYFRDIEKDEFLGEDDLSVFLGGDSDYEYEDAIFGDIVSFLTEGDEIYVEMSPGIKLKGLAVKAYTGSALRAQVIYDGEKFSLGDYRFVSAEEN